MGLKAEKAEIRSAAAKTLGKITVKDELDDLEIILEARPRIGQTVIHITSGLIGRLIYDQHDSQPFGVEFDIEPGTNWCTVDEIQAKQSVTSIFVELLDDEFDVRNAAAITLCQIAS